MVFFLKKYSDSQWCWKKYSDFGGGKKKSDSEFLSYNIMLNSGKKIHALRDKKINILTLVFNYKHLGFFFYPCILVYIYMPVGMQLKIIFSIIFMFVHCS